MDKKNKNNTFPFPFNKYTNAPSQFSIPPSPFPYGSGFGASIPPVVYMQPQKISFEETSLYEIEGILSCNYLSKNATPSLVFSKFINHLIDDADNLPDPENGMKLTNLLKIHADTHTKIVIDTITFLDKLVEYFGGNPDIGTTDNEDPDVNINALIETLMDPSKVKDYICLSTMVICLGSLKLRTLANILRQDSPIYGSPFCRPTSMSLKTFLEELRASYEKADDGEENSANKAIRNQYRLDIGKALLRYAVDRKMNISEVHMNIWYDTYFPIIGVEENGKRDLFIDRYIETNRF